MQKLLLIAAYGLNILIAIFGNYGISYFSQTPFYEKSVELLFIVALFGLLDGVRPVAVRYGSKENFDINIYQRIVKLNNRFAIHSLSVVVIVVGIINFLPVLDKVLIVVSIYPLLLSSVFLGLVDSKGMFGSAAFVRTAAWLILFLILIALSLQDNVAYIYISVAFYSIIQLLLSYLLFKLYVFIPELKEGTGIGENLTSDFIDSYKTNIFRTFVDFSDRLLLFSLTTTSFRSGYLSRIDLAQKYVNAAQLISLYIYPRLCMMPCNEVRIIYFKRLFFPVLLVLYCTIFFVLINSETILNFYFNNKLTGYNYLFKVFVVSLLFNFQSFLFVPLLRSCGDFSTPKNTFIITAVLIFSLAGVVVFILGFDPNYIAYIFLLSKIGYIYNNVFAFKIVFKSWNTAIPASLLIMLTNFSFLLL